MNIMVVKLGRLEYGKALAIQEKLLALRQAGKMGDIMLLVEHPPVLTVGRRGEYSNILLPTEELKAAGVEIFDVNRGGDVTYHGPGQIVGYPIMDLNEYGRDIKDYVGKIEEVFIRLLKDDYGMTAHRDDKKYTGVWVENSKITAIGIAVKRWVTMHGFAFNVNTDLDHFKWINPCGIMDRGVTSLQKLLGHAENYEKLNERVIFYFTQVFGLEEQRITPDELDVLTLL
ncbi:MAG: lipoyl(octanoyl) transferase LipB [Ruminiclostridium sp.]|nr:lipoyl(octanoyl) transferase LipB [Ruminiclostridium sp.]